MKKLISVLLVLCMMFSLTACSDSNNTATENTDNIVITQPTLDPSEDINVPAADPGEQPEELPTPEVDEEGETVGAETPEEPEESTQPEENEPSADPNASTAGDMLFSKFVEIAADSSLSAQEIADKLNAEGFRVETDFRNEKLGYKLREAQTNKIPYMVVVGDKEAEDGTIALRKRMVGDQGTMTMDAFMEMIRTERDTRSC